MADFTTNELSLLHTASLAAAHVSGEHGHHEQQATYYTLGLKIQALLGHAV